jgi:hypothetical protein
MKLPLKRDCFGKLWRTDPRTRYRVSGWRWMKLGCIALRKLPSSLSLRRPSLAATMSQLVTGCDWRKGAPCNLALACTSVNLALAYTEDSVEQASRESIRILNECYPFTDVQPPCAMTLSSMFAAYAFTYPHSRNLCLVETSKL